jgi:hypothetical protein
MWVVGHRFGFDNVEFVGVKYGDPVPDMTGRDVYIVDFSYPPAVLIPAAKTAKKITVLDHHETARKQWTPEPVTDELRSTLMKLYPEAIDEYYRVGTVTLPEDGPPEAMAVKFEPIPDNLEIYFAHERAGTCSTWTHLFPGKAIPPVLEAIDNGDRWIFDQFPQVREVCEYCRSKGLLRASPENFKMFTKLVTKTDGDDDPWDNYNEIANKGADIIDAFDNLVSEFVPFDNPRLIDFMGYTVPCHAVPDFFKSGVGDRFGKQYPFSITYDDNLVPGHRKFSLRSDKETGVDVEQIAKEYNGGGHEHAAGFIIAFDVKTMNASVQSMLYNRFVMINEPSRER